MNFEFPKKNRYIFAKKSANVCLLFSRPNQRFSTTDQSSADERNLNQEPLSYNDTQTLRADQRLNYPPPPKENEILNGHHHNNQQQFHEKTQFRQLHLDYDMNNKENNSSQPAAATIQNRAEPQQQASATRIPSGHMRRDRASLRAKHRKEMEQAKLQVKILTYRYPGPNCPRLRACLDGTGHAQGL